MNIKKALRSSLAAIAVFLLSAQAFSEPDGFSQQTVLSGLTKPVYLSTLPDGRMLVLQQEGEILIFDPADAPPVSAQRYLRITNIESRQERGLTSIALDPDFETNGYIYVYYTHGSSDRNRISRFTHQGNTADLGSELVIWEDNEPWTVLGSCCHFGGGLGFGPDGKLYLTTGEEFEGAQSEDLSQAGGKIIRINKDGSIPSDNPFVDVNGALDEIWATGLRNPFRAYWDLPSGRFFIGDVGGNVQSTAYEEINLGIAGADYGWPNCEGPDGCPANAELPIFSYPHTGNTPLGGAVAAGFVYRGSQYPASYNERFFYADYALSFIRMLTFNPNGSVTDEAFDSNIGAPVHLVQGPDDAMYAVDYLGRVLRYNYTSGNQPPTISTVSATPEEGQAPLTVNFSVSASDPTDPLTYRWVFGDGSPDSTMQNPSHTYQDAGPYFAFVEVSDGTQSVFSEQIRIQVGNVPVVTIQTPEDGDIFRAGDMITLTGTASDATIPSTDYCWEVLLFHNAHTHPSLTQCEDAMGTPIEIEIESFGHDWHDATGYEITLTVTNSDGLSGSDTVRIYPDKVDITIDTMPSGIPVFIDGISLGTPQVYDTLIGFQHQIEAPENHCLNGEQFVFNGWSNGGNRSQAYLVPTTNQSLTASYVPAGACVPFPQDGLVFHVEADAGVTTAVESSTVTGWADQSGQGNNLAASGNPQLIANGLNGEAIISFDGSGDILERLTAVSGLPAGNTDRTVYTVVRYDDTGYGGISYGSNAINEAFGLIVAPNGNLMIQGWGNANDFDSGVAGSNMGWMIQSAVHQAGNLRHYRDGSQIDTRTHSYATDPTSIVIGAEIDRSPFLDMDVAAVMIYDRALSPAERSDIESYLDVKYFGGVDITILSPADGATVSSGDVTVTYTVAGSNFNHVHLSLDGAEPVMVFETSGSYTFNGVAAGPHVVAAELVDASHQTIMEDGASATVNFTADDCFPDNFAPNCTVDTDGDGTPDSAETETADSDSDGTPDYLESSILDPDADGLPNQVDPANDDVCVPNPFTTGCTVDTDGDGTPDSVEGETTDSDGDGLPDYTESSILDADRDGTVDQADRGNLDPCIPDNTGAGCSPPPSRSGGSGGFSITWLIALGGLLALRRRRYTL